MAQLLTFQVAKYQAALESKFRVAAEETQYEVYMVMMSRLAAIPWKTNPVKIVTGGSAGDVTVTSDLERAGEVMANVLRTRAKVMSRNRIKATIRFVKRNWKDAHIGVYYEVGTGAKYDGTHITNLPKPSGYASASHSKGAIQSRSRFVDYVGMGPGKWIDMGGNVRVTKSKRAGEVTAAFKSYIGPDVKPHRWFRDAVRMANKILRRKMRRAIRLVPITKFLKLHNQTIRVGK